MNAQHADLTRANYDLVVGTTQAAIHSTLLQFISETAWEDRVEAYVRPESAEGYEKVDFGKLCGDVGFDPFAIADRTASDDDRLKKLDDYRFAFALKATMGVPDLPKYPPVITLSAEYGDPIKYVVYLAQLAAIELTVSDDNNRVWTHARQDGGPPWCFTYNVWLTQREYDGGFDKLPEALRQHVTRVSGATDFGVEELVIDLYEHQPSLVGTSGIDARLDRNGEVYGRLTRKFVPGVYWRELKQHHGHSLGVCVRPRVPDASRPTIVPAILDRMVSPHVDPSGDPDAKQDLFTLNYVATTSAERQLPDPDQRVPFTWNWVEEDEQRDFHGAIGIRRNVFVEYLRDLIAKPAAGLCFSTSVAVTSGIAGVDTRYGYKWTPDGPTFTLPSTPVRESDGYATVLTFDQSSRAHGEALAFDLTHTVKGDFDYTLGGRVAFKDSTIRIVTHGVVYFSCEIVVLGARVRQVAGNIVSLTTTIDYALEVTAAGGLTVVSRSTEANTREDPQIGLIDWIIIGDTSDVIHRMRDEVETALRSAMKTFDDAILRLLTSQGWVFPGAKSFVFKNVSFSAAQDLIVRVTYVSQTD
jgi:hypothetical protein